MSDSKGWSGSSATFGSKMMAIPLFYSHQASLLALERMKQDLSSNLEVPRQACDVAAGVGTFTSVFIKLIDETLKTEKKQQTLWNFEVTDFAEGLLTTGKQRFEEDPILNSYPVNFKVMNAEDLKFSDNQFDLVSCKFGIMFVPNKTLAIHEMNRILKPQGTLIMSTWHQTDLADITLDFGRFLGSVKVDEIPSEMNFAQVYKDSSQLEQALNEAGFRNIDVHPVEHEFLIDHNQEFLNAILANPVMKAFVGDVSSLNRDIHEDWNKFLSLNAQKWLRNDSQSIRLSMTANIAVASK